MNLATNTFINLFYLNFMKTFKLMLAALVAFAMFSCKTEPTDGNGETAKMVVRITNVKSGGTRADADAVTTGYTTTLSSAYVFVVDGNGNVVNRHQFTNEELAATPSPKAEFEAKTTAAEILLVGNYPSDFNPASYLTKGDLEGAVIDMAKLGLDLTGGNTLGVENAMLYNDSDAGNGTVTGQSGTEMSAAVSIAPVVARIEVKKLQGLTTVTGSFDPLVSFELEGIYLNRVHSGVKLSNPLTPAGNFLYDELSAPIADRGTNYPWLCDVFATPATGLVFEPVNEVWAYHIAPVEGTFMNGSVSTENVPNVVFKLNNITYSGSGLATGVVKYVVVTGFTTGGATPTLIEKFERRNVYTIETVEFESDKLRDEYVDETLKLTVTVTIKPWLLQTVTPII